MRKIRSFSLIFADFRFSWKLQHFGGADFRRKPQEPADFRRNPFVPFSLSLLVPPSFHKTCTRKEAELEKVQGTNDEGQQDQESPRGKSSSERVFERTSPKGPL